ncbi:MAG: PrsW family glutamic-type intramembrane protease [Leptospirales bacterium]|jgi:RsiW-degrading membrane proteinase PrsW (M82 family)
METLVKIASSLGVVAIFFVFYFRNFVFRRSAVLQTAAFFWGVLSAAVTLIVQLYGLERLLPPDRPTLSRALIDAALIEELVRFAFIYFYLRRSRPTFTIVEGVFDGILVGLGFAVVENFHYGLNYNGLIILLRSLTSAPLHAFLSGIMAFFISYAHLRSTTYSDGASRSGLRSARMWYLHGTAFLIPWCLHAAYDMAFLLGAFTFVIPLILIGTFLFLENLFYRARLYFGKNVLNMIGIDVEDLEVFLRQQEYEKWLEENQDEERPRPTLFLNEWSPATTLVGCLALSLAAAMTALYFAWPEAGVFRRLPDEAVRVSMLMVFPATVGFMLLAADKINYLYLRDVLLSVPMALTIEVERQGRGKLIAVAMDLLPSGVFISDQEKFSNHERVLIRLRGEHAVSPQVMGHIRWSNRFNTQLPVGHIVRFDSRSPALFWYRFRYQMWKLSRLRRLFSAGE